MTASIEVTIDAVDVDRATDFWSEALGYRLLSTREPYRVLGPPEGDRRPRIIIQRVDGSASEKTPVHLDLRVDDPPAEVERLSGLGASVAWVVEDPGPGFDGWTVMTDPEGTHFCVCTARIAADGTDT